MRKPRILLIATHPEEVASTRYRVLAYLPALREAGCEVEFHPFFPSESLEGIYSKERWGEKTAWVLRGAQSRWRRLRLQDYDLVFIHRELFPLGISLGMALLDKPLRKSGARLIYDFDDAIFLPHRQNRGLAGRLENPASVSQIISRCSQVIAGNSFLAAYAGRFNPAVCCIPTPVDTDRYSPAGAGHLS